MSWFDTAGFASFAKSALNSAQKTIDRALDIKEDSSGSISSQKINEDENFFGAFGLGNKAGLQMPKSSVATSTSGTTPSAPSNVKVLESSTAKDNSGFWGDTWGSFFEMGNKTPLNRPEGDNAGSSNSAPEKIVNKVEEEAVEEHISPAVLSQPHCTGLFPAGNKEDINSQNKSVIVESTVQKSETNIENDDSLCEETRCADEEDLSLHTSLPHSESSSVDDTNKHQHFNILDDKSEQTSECSVELENVNNSVLLEFQENKSSLCTDKYHQVVLVSEIPTDHKEKVADSFSSQSEEAHSKLQRKTLDDAVTTQPSQVCENLVGDFCVVEDKVTSKDTLHDKAPSLPEASLLPVQEQPKCSPDTFDNFLESNLQEWEWDSMRHITGGECSSPVMLNLQLVKTTNLCSNNLLLPPEETLSSPDSIIQISESQKSGLSTPHYGEPSVALRTFISISDMQVGKNIVSSLTGKDQWLGESENLEYESSNYEERNPVINKMPNENKDDDETEAPEVQECEIKSSDSGGSQGTSSSSSFVKCSVEEVDSSYSHRGQSPMSVTASERSDVTKFESEQNSGHTSGDENETATSSDIEIISPPNGENGDRQITSPLKHLWIPRPHRSRRSESPASDSSKDNVMPVVREVEEDPNDHHLKLGIRSSFTRVSASDASMESQQKPFHKDDMEKLFRRQEEMQEVLNARERRVLELSKENIEVIETNAQLRRQIKEMEAAYSKESRDVSELTKEFTQRLANLETELQQTKKEKDTLENQLQAIKAETTGRLSFGEIETLLKEKDQQIVELTEEGEKLSKKELHHTTIIKKLRAKEDEMENLIKSQKDRLEDNSKELERLRKSLGAKDEQEKKHIDAIRQLTSNLQKHEKDVSALKSDLEDANEKALSLKKALDSSYREIAELHRANAEKETQAKEVALSCEMAVKEELRLALEQTTRDTAQEKEMLLNQIDSLRINLTKTERNAHIREEMLQVDVATLQQRLQEAEGRNEELTRNVSSATRPLLRQLENLQATFSSQSSTWEKVEKSLTERLNDTQRQLSVFSEKERTGNEKLLELTSQISALETQNNSLRQDKVQLSSQLEMMKMKVIMLEESKCRESLSLQSIKQNLVEEIDQLKQEKSALSLQLQLCEEQLESERKKAQQVLEESKEKDRKMSEVTITASSSPSPSESRMSSVSESVNNWLQDDHSDVALGMSAANYNRLSLYDSVRSGNATSLLEGLQSQLKQREGEIAQLQSDIMQLERVKESMMQELASLTDHNNELELELVDLEKVKDSYSQLEQKYNTLLQMYGEKVEEAEELRLDLQDVKTMYKAQIEELLQKV